MVVMLWANEVFDRQRPDTFRAHCEISPRVHGWPKAIEPLALFAKDQPLKAHGLCARQSGG